MRIRNQLAARAVTTAYAALAAGGLMLWIVPRFAAGQDAQDSQPTVTIIYGDDSKLTVTDWHFVYEYLESDAPLDELFVATCRGSLAGDFPCYPQIKTAKDLYLLGPLPGPSAAAQVPFVLPGSVLGAIWIHWQDGPGPYEKDGVTLNRNRTDERYQSDAMTIVLAQGAQIRFAGRLRTLDAFLSNKRYVYLMKLSLAGTVQVQGTPGHFELNLDSRLPTSSLKERVEEVRFREE